jgi:hypothetical protein
MDNQDPIDRHFLVFVAIMAAFLIALGFVLYPHP